MFFGFKSCITPVKPIYRSERIQVQKPAQPSTRLQAQPNDQRPQNGRVLEPIVILRSPKKIPRLRNPPERAYFTAARSKPATPKGSVLTKIRAISKQTYKGRQSPPVRAYFAGSASSPATREDSAMADTMTAATKSVPPTRQGTPLSPLSEELFGDILDSKLPTVPLRWFSDSSYSEEEPPEAETPYPKSRNPQPNTTPDTLFGDMSGTAARTSAALGPSDSAHTTEISKITNEVDVFGSMELKKPNSTVPSGSSKVANLTSPYPPLRMLEPGFMSMRSLEIRIGARVTRYSAFERCEIRGQSQLHHRSHSVPI